MTKKRDVYEKNADDPGYIYFIHFPDMRLAAYKFSDDHIHESVEVVVCYKGRLRCTLNDVTRDISAGEIFIVNKWNAHRFDYIENASCYIIVIGWDYIGHILNEKQEFNNFIHPDEKCFNKIVKLLQEADLSIDKFNYLLKQGFVNNLFGLLAEEKLFRTKNYDKREQLFIDINKYIDENYKHAISLDDLAKYVGYSKNYLSSLFNAVMGKSLVEYINEYRLKKVAQKRINSHEYLRWIVRTCGFGSMETYYRTLKKQKKSEERDKVMKKSTKTKKKWATIVGYGNRGQVYGGYSLANPDELGIAAVVDPNVFRLKEAKERYNLQDCQLFRDFRSFLDSEIECDFVINATMDQYHYETAMEILDAGYDMLLEKPVVPVKEQFLAIQNKAREKNCHVYVCHVLRYTPFYRSIKEFIKNGTIGEIISMEMNEHVANSHYLTSYLRGKWNSEEKCGSGLLLAKCCHDIDLVCWFNNSTKPRSVMSEGARREYIKANQPEGATEFCYECPHERECIHSAIRQYIEWDVMPFLVWDRLNKPLDEITKEEKIEFLKHDVYGRCAYDIPGADLVDRQQVLIRFDNGSTCSFTLSAGCAKADRYIHIVGTKGEIEGKLESNEFTVRTFNLNKLEHDEKVINIKDQVVMKAQFGGHYGGDYNIMHDLIAHMNGDETYKDLTRIEDSLNGHLCVYAAEKSRKENRIVELSDD